MPRRASLAGKWKSRIVSKQHRLAFDFKCGSKLTFCNSARQLASTIFVAKFESLDRLMTVFEAVMRVWRSRELRSFTIHGKRFAFRRLSRVFAHRAYNVIVFKFNKSSDHYKAFTWSDLRWISADLVRGSMSHIFEKSSHSRASWWAWSSLLMLVKSERMPTTRSSSAIDIIGRTVLITSLVKIMPRFFGWKWTSWARARITNRRTWR